MAKRISGKAPTLGDLAKAAGVSKGTASNVFNRPDIVSASVRQRVLEAGKAIGYGGPDPRGRVFSAGKINAIGVATMEPLAYFFEDPFARALMAGITTACDASGSGVSLISAANEEQLAWNMRSALVDGFILFCVTGAERLIALSRERNLPFVALDLGTSDDSLCVVGIDNVAGARQAARHMADLGHRRFAVLALPFFSGDPATDGTPDQPRLGYFTPRDRLQGYFEVLQDFGVDTSLVPVLESDGDADSVHAALDDIFTRSPPPTALLAQSDAIALRVMAQLKMRGCSVPGDVSVIGFDGIAEGATSDPPLTTIQQPIESIGQKAVAAILDHSGETRRDILATELVVRGSTASPSDRD